jgi:hypothetical protein
MTTNLRHGDLPIDPKKSRPRQAWPVWGAAQLGSWIGQTIHCRAEAKPGQGSGNRVVSYSTRLGIEAWF